MLEAMRYHTDSDPIEVASANEDRVKEYQEMSHKM